MWLDFKHNCIETLAKHVPSKMTTTRFNQPWIDRNTRRLSRRKKRAYRKARNTNNNKDKGSLQKHPEAEQTRLSKSL
jgi:transcriptional regulatory protein LevR